MTVLVAVMLLGAVVMAAGSAAVRAAARRPAYRGRHRATW